MKLLSLNLELSKHLSRVEERLASIHPDVTCFQELAKKDIDRLEKTFGPLVTYHPAAFHEVEDGVVEYGVGIFSRHTASDVFGKYYVGDPAQLPTLGDANFATFDPSPHVLIGATLAIDGETYRILTTHFTWTPNGESNDAQRKDMVKMLEYLSAEEEFVLSGDFNAPRGGEMFSELSSRYIDTIPPQYKTSIDITLHRAGRLRPEQLADKMVDGLFTTPHYTAENVALVSGVSDHMAIVADIQRA